MKPLKINNKFEIESTVYLKTDVDQLERTVVYIVVYANSLLYGVRYSDCEITEHEDFEISTEKFPKL